MPANSRTGRSVTYAHTSIPPVEPRPLNRCNAVALMLAGTTVVCGHSRCADCGHNNIGKE